MCRVYTAFPMTQGLGPKGMVLLYNMQGSRIHAVGVSQLGDIRQEVPLTGQTVEVERYRYGQCLEIGVTFIL